MRRDLRPEDYTRIKHYARRIRVLDSESSAYTPSLHHLVLPILHSRNPDKTPILINIKKLVISLHQFEGTATFPRLVIGPALQTIVVLTICYYFEISTKNIPWKNLFASLKICQQSIRALEFESTLDGGLLDIDFASREHGLMPLLSSCSGLNMVQIGPIHISGDELHRLSVMDSLQELSINLDLVKAWKISRLGNGAGCFLHLQKLEFCTIHIKLALRLLSYEGFTQLQYLHITQVHNNVWDLKQLFQLLGTRFFDSQLQSINVSRTVYLSAMDLDDGDHLNHQFVLTPQILIALFPLRNLTELSVKPSVTLTLDDNVLKDMANSWPSLRVLRLRDNASITTPMLNLASVLFITTACPALEELALRIDARRCPEFSDIADIVPSNLRKLDVCRSLAENDEEIAAFLTVAFPNLQSFTHGFPYLSSGLDADNKLSRRVWKAVYTDMQNILSSHQGDAE